MKDAAALGVKAISITGEAELTMNPAVITYTTADTGWVLYVLLRPRRAFYR